MSKKQKKIIVLASMFALTFGIVPNVSAMHIMEGYLPGGFCIAWGVICVPFLIAGFMSIKKTLNEHRNLITLLAMSGAFVFVISSLKIPSVTGSCSHMTGTGLGAILFGPSAVSILGIIVLLFQAILLAHGGLTTLGANTFSMAIAGPFVSYGIFFVCKKCRVNKHISIFLAATLGDLFTYCVTAVQMALAHHADTTIMGAMGKFLLVFAPTQLPLAIIEGIITVLIIMGLETYAKPELRTIGFLKGAK
nr:energy-coupling factor ABC transporter permease [uncultured Blautia sp.]